MMCSKKWNKRYLPAHFTRKTGICVPQNNSQHNHKRINSTKTTQPQTETNTRIPQKDAYAEWHEVEIDNASQSRLPLIRQNSCQMPLPYRNVNRPLSLSVPLLSLGKFIKSNCIPERRPFNSYFGWKNEFLNLVIAAPSKPNKKQI